MDRELANKHREIDDTHYEAKASERIEHFDQKFRDEAMEFRGAFRAIGHVARNANAQLIHGLIRIEETKYYRVWGFKQFVDYLNSDEVPEISKTTFYRLKPLYLAEGAERFDVYSGNKVPLKARKLLAANNVQFTLENNELVIGDTRVPVSDSAGVNELFDAFCSSIRERDARNDKLEHENNKLKDQREIGRTEILDLQRHMDAINEQTPYERALMGVVHAMITLVTNVKDLGDEERAERGPADLKTIAGQYFQLCDEYGVHQPLSQRQIADPSDAFEAKLAAALAEPDDLDNDD